MALQASFAERVSAHVDRSTELLDEIRRAATYLRTRQKYALWQLREVTGLHKNSLLRLADHTWVPKGDTMVALAKLVERAQAHRKGETFTFPARRGPGRPPASQESRPPKTETAADLIHRLHPKAKRRSNGKTRTAQAAA